MLIPNTSGVSPLRPIQTRTAGNEHAASAPVSTNYDRVELSSAQMSPEQRFAHELAGRISQEVRTHRSPDVPEIAQQIDAGTYQWDIGELAARIMLYGGEMQ